jgi:hypothetical protein
MAIYVMRNLTKRIKISNSTIAYPDAFNLINYRLKTFSVICFGNGHRFFFACSVVENIIADTALCPWTTSVSVERIPSSVSFGSLFSMTSYETASLLKQIRPVSALL